MSILELAEEVHKETLLTAEPPCVVGKALRLLQKHNPDDIDAVKEWIAGAKTRVETAEILTRYVAKHNGGYRVAEGSVGSHGRGGCTCDRYGLA